MIFKNSPLNERIKWSDLVALNVLLVLCYFLVVSGFGFPGGVSHLMFSTPDTLEYKEFAGWMNGETVSCSDTRPFFYPLLLLISNACGGVMGTWLMQFFFWLLSVNLVFLSLIKLTNSYLLAGVGSAVLASNLSLILLTMYGLCEVTVIFLLSVFIFYVTHYYEKRSHPKFILSILFLASIMTVVKPVYHLLVLFLLFIVFPVSYFKVFMKRKILFLILLLTISPVIVQVAIMKMNHNTYSISKIGSITLRDYYYRLLFSRVHHISLDEANGLSENASDQQVVDFIFSHPSESLETYRLVLKGNLNAGSELINKVEHEGYSAFMQNVNNYYYDLHRFFLILILLSLFILYKYSRNFILYFFLLFIPLYLIILTSGISFYQGDRLVLPSLPVWIVLYTFIGQFLFNYFLRKGYASFLSPDSNILKQETNN